MTGTRPSEKELAEIYNRYFKVVQVVTEEHRVAAFRLRYQVYCLEHGFERPSDYPDGLEVDGYDLRSVATGLLYRQTNDLIGTVRLVLPDAQNLGQSLPLQEICTDPKQWPIDFLPFETTAEVSRYAVTKQFRRRVGEERYADVPSLGAEPLRDVRRAIPYITIGLMRGVLDMSVEYRITHLVAVMEPFLQIALRRVGLEFKQLGPAVEYHGVRVPYWARLDDLVNGMRSRRLDMYTAVGGLKAPDADGPVSTGNGMPATDAGSSHSQ